MEEATATYQAAVTADAARYLLARGIDQHTAATFRLGVVADPLPGHERFRGYLAIPYLDRDDHPLSIRFRCLNDGHVHREHGHGKYMSLAGEPARVYNVSAVHRADDEIHIAEGEFDAQVLTIVGLPAIAIPGASGWKAHHRRMLAGFSRAWVWGDADDAGADFTTRVCRSLRTAKGVRLRRGDVTDTYLRDGANALHALVGTEVAA
ncbi:toprim domain-containing protein [Actinoplanes sp. NPDC049265]|uniref:toprim domain-containing protein n=1 Tax=Actinoplanes sp. NPDC049265 TaxID=3363902 RepID=UPI003712F6F1